MQRPVLGRTSGAVRHLWFQIESGEILGPDGRTYVRRAERLKRAAADELIDAGAPLVTYRAADGDATWHPGGEARTRWSQVRAAVTPDGPKGTPRGTVWTAGRWQTTDGHTLVLLTDNP